MSVARDEILARIRQSTGGARPRTLAQPPSRDDDRRTRAVLLELLVERLIDYRALVERTSGFELPRVLDRVLDVAGARRVVVPPLLPRELRPAGVDLIEDDGLTPYDLDRVDGALTGCTLAVAETGTIVLAAGDFAGRRALTLVPDLHVCVVREEQVVADVQDAIAMLGPLVRRSRAPLTLVSGPSATSDIELGRVEGVHGPRRLVVVIVEEARS